MTACPDCRPPLDPRDVNLFIAQFNGPLADEQIWRELA